jgi:hypothetical protein
MKNKCQNTSCSREFSYFPHTSYLINKSKVLKVCNKCNQLEIELRLKKLYKGKSQKISKEFETLLKIINTQSNTIRNLTVEKFNGDNNG